MKAKDNMNMKTWKKIMIACISAMVCVVFIPLLSGSSHGPAEEFTPGSTAPQGTLGPSAGPVTLLPVVSTPRPTPTPSPTPTPDPIAVMVASMSLDEKIGQMIIGGYDAVEEIVPVVAGHMLGGVILFKDNIKSAAQVKEDIQGIIESNKGNPVPLFISTDQEGGAVNRLPKELGSFESAMSIGDRDDPEYAFNAGVKLAKAIKELGFNLDFAPVLDIFSNPKNTVIATRAYGTTAERVAEMGLQVLYGIRSEDIVPVAKHFPGHGDTQVDSHIGLPIVNKSLEELMDFEFVPFIRAIENKADMIMVAHIMLSQVDNVPSTLSSKVVTGILRKQLGYQGVIITDDMTMGAIVNDYTVNEAAVMAVSAGCDIVLVAHGAQNCVLVIDAIRAAVGEGRLTEKRIDESVYRILSLKARYGLLNP